MRAPALVYWGKNSDDLLLKRTIYPLTTNPLIIPLWPKGHIKCFAHAKVLYKFVIDFNFLIVLYINNTVCLIFNNFGLDKKFNSL